MDAVKKTVDLTNQLIGINNDRQTWYTKALNELTGIENLDLKSILEELLEQAKKFANELSPFVVINGQEPATNTTISGRFQFFWSDIRSTLAQLERKQLLVECEQIENTTRDLYKNVLDHAPHLSDKLVTVLQTQVEIHHMSYEKIHALK
ncbi:PA2169 family four-helix-bundle protein [Sphingobacterium olei]|uniref:PA2169 family four-helix-bundle protein n=1 Tax=Sphingobacterium olei TaxID=2571155 RepID=A0A4U0NBT9_9SPHI|nr:PA2169 family four-helix-bundle protein [Sphingobacterium olei]TJZ51427.1 PA2169 family four-helix-bundle protein [Sphingobacterium olei]